MATVTKEMEKSPEQNIEHLRGLDWFNPTDHQDRGITIVGCGGIGSFSALALSKLIGTNGPSMTLIDFDDVEPHNVPNQLFAWTQTEMSKVHALSTTCLIFGGLQPEAVEGKVQDHPYVLSDIVVTGLDSMEARKDVWEAIGTTNTTRLLLDGRLLGERMTLHAIDMDDENAKAYYEHELLYDDSEAEQAVCTAQAIIYVGMFVGGLTARAVAKYLTLGRVEHTVSVNADTLNTIVATELDQDLVSQYAER